MSAAFTRFERLGAAAAGCAAVIVGLGTGGFVARLLDTPTPLTSLATFVIDKSPRALERWAIDTFQTHDKQVLAGSIVVVLGVLGALIGRRSLAQHRAAFGGALALAAVGVVLTLASRTAGAKACIPVVLSAASGWLLLRSLLSYLDPFRTPGVPDGGTNARSVLDRRRFLGLTGLSAAGGTLLGFAGGSVTGSLQAAEDSRRSAENKLRAAKTISTSSSGGDATATLLDVPPVPVGADLQIQGLTPWRVPVDSFYRIDTAFVVPRLQSDNWDLTIKGLVRKTRTYTYDQLLERATMGRDITLMCVSNEIGGDLIGTAYFQGVPLKELLDECGVLPEAEQVYSVSEDLWSCGFPVENAMDGRDAMVAVAMNGEPLTFEHGFPARLVVPGIYGYVSATKWVRRIELLKWADMAGYWIPRGWAERAPIKTCSRIDVPRDRATVPASQVAVAGVAWAQHRGIDRVEVQVDGGAWREAEVATEANVDTWRQWKFAWDAAAAGVGVHTIAVRATDRNGDLQPLGPKPVAPDGAEGFHTIRVKVT